MRGTPQTESALVAVRSVLRRDAAIRYIDEHVAAGHHDPAEIATAYVDAIISLMREQPVRNLIGDALDHVARP